MGDALLDVIFDPDVADGAGLVIDGFPRTALQVHTVLPAPDVHSTHTAVPQLMHAAEHLVSCFKGMRCRRE